MGRNCRIFHIFQNFVKVLAALKYVFEYIALSENVGNGRNNIFKLILLQMTARSIKTECTSKFDEPFITSNFVITDIKKLLNNKVVSSGNPYIHNLSLKWPILMFQQYLLPQRFLSQY